MKKLRLRVANDVDLTRTFSASIRGGQRGYEDAMAVESHSNDVAPTIKCLQGFTLIVEVEDEQDDKIVVGSDGSVMFRRPFKGGGTIAIQRLQFSSNLGIAFCISAERVPQVIVYEED